MTPDDGLAISPGGGLHPRKETMQRFGSSGTIAQEAEQLIKK